MTIAIIGAEVEEIQLLKSQMNIEMVRQYAGRDFVVGSLFDQSVVIVLARIGKVAAAVTTTILLENFEIDLVLFTGIAGAGCEDIAIGDVVVADYLLQHDVDVRPFREQFEVPIHGKSLFEAEYQQAKKLLIIAKKFLAKDIFELFSKETLNEFAIRKPRARLMTVASGDQFISDAEVLKNLREQIKLITERDLGCVEMEGAAVAQVCHEYDKPCLVLRVISDNANHLASVDFDKFLKEIASRYVFGIVREFLKQYSKT